MMVSSDEEDETSRELSRELLRTQSVDLNYKETDLSFNTKEQAIGKSMFITKTKSNSNKYEISKQINKNL